MRTTFKAFLIFIICVNASSISKAQINVQDSLILIDFYNSTGGPNWTVPDNKWANGAPVNKWYGVEVDSGRVTKLNLEGLNLKGIIPSTIGNLSKLTSIYLVGNQLTGNIPSTLGNLTQLEKLYLEVNEFTGTIPSSLGNLSQLTELSVWHNRLTGDIPSVLGNLSELQLLDLSGNQLSGTIPKSLGNLTKLTILVLHTNRLSDSIPSSIGNLPNLTLLYLYNNRLSGPIPGSLSLARTYIIDVTNNLFTFDGMEALAKAYVGEKNGFDYSPQHSIPLYFNDTSLWVNAGGTLSNNTYQLYKNGTLLSTKIGDSLFKLGYSDRDSFYISVTNALATKLTLYTDTIQLASSYYTIKDGNWNDPAIWSSSAIPPVTANIFIRHNVIVNQNVTCYAIKIEPPKGSIDVQSGIHFTVTH